MKKLILLVILLNINSVNFLIAQTATPKILDMGIEIGGGYNTLNWVKSAGVLCLGDGVTKRNNMFLTPTIRFSYRSTIYQNIFAQLFMGYNEFGGKSENDYYHFKSHEFGSFLNYQHSHLAYATGYKINRINKAKYHMNYIDEERKKWFNKYSQNIGFKISYLYKHFSIGAEAWLGTKNLSAWNGEVYENHYRIMIGYYFIS